MGIRETKGLTVEALPIARNGQGKRVPSASRDPGTSSSPIQFQIEFIVVTSSSPRIADIMAGHSHPVHVHAARPLYRFTATALGASMWFFLMYRAKKDGPALLGWKHPWDH
ncbi:hypothetical protein N7492_002842 [Penicillium capsulatum]|uniref:NADH dehydrogenase [ubiquinone] 1 beta subcomplex subunit 2 n=1 Tax=Penicillium capsulatum TaxID=69766 RepID=A0A9W9LWT5_9EURO|nr:hypothetical protein N7492_002842 [Penicillium capsulatum]KAJ6122561.1 hypothetical protein N7512_005026 [Penicillium capsulatum]